MAITLKNSASDLAAALNALTLGGVTLATGRNLFTTQVRAVPTMAVFCLNNGGEQPEPYLSPTASAFFRAHVELLIHGIKGGPGFTAGETLARAIHGQLHQSVPSGYVAVYALDAQPNYLGIDEDDRHQWQMTFEAQYVA
jgi:hypothetical protein